MKIRPGALILIIVLTAVTATLTNASFIEKHQNLLRQKYEVKNEQTEQRCRSCHNKTYMEATTDKTTHLPFANWYCTDCHQDNEQHISDPARNPINLRVDREQLCNTCHRNPVELVARNQHQPWGTGKCTDCHHPHASGKPKLVRFDQKNLCASCHRLQSQMAGYTSNHEPFIQEDCSVCHNPHASDYRGITRLETGMLCSTCHIKHIPDLSKPYKHGPFGRQECTYCHNPHASKGQNLLSGSVPSACYNCHPQVKEEMAKPVKHGPVQTGECNFCHQPHASRAPGLLPDGGCITCHLNLAPMYSAASRHPVDRGGFSCTNCHKSHGSFEKFLLDQKGNEVCAKCHTGIVLAAEKSKHSAVNGSRPEGDCLNCHRVHYTLFEPLLPINEKALCYTCHDQEKLKTMNTSHGPAINKGMINCSDCHDPHGLAGVESLLIAKDNDLCRKCHAEIFAGMQ